MRLPKTPGPLDLMVEGTVAHLTLTAPAERNALRGRTIRAAHEAIDAAEADPTVRVLVVGHTGEWFCSGMDLAEAGDSAAGSDDFFGLLERLAECDLVSIAAVGGRAVGGGVGLAAACDVVIAGTDATFALPEALWGLLPAAVYPFLRRRVGGAAARRLALTTRVLNATEALALGLADEVDEILPRAVATTARRAACIDRAAVRRIKDFALRFDPIPSGARAAASEALADAVAAPGVTARIDRWRRTGRLPWE